MASSMVSKEQYSSGAARFIACNNVLHVTTKRHIPQGAFSHHHLRCVRRGFFDKHLDCFIPVEIWIVDSSAVEDVTVFRIRLGRSAPKSTMREPSVSVMERALDVLHKEVFF